MHSFIRLQPLGETHATQYWIGHFCGKPTRLRKVSHRILQSTLALFLAFVCAAASRSASAATTDYDGTWKATLSCGSSVYHDPPFTRSFEVTINFGKFIHTETFKVKNVNKSVPVIHAVKWTGGVEDNSLEVTGKGTTDDIVMLPGLYAFKGAAISAQQFGSVGTLSQTSVGPRLGSQIAGCKLELVSRVPAPMSLAARPPQTIVPGQQASTSTPAPTSQTLDRDPPNRTTSTSTPSNAYDGTWKATVTCGGSITNNPPFSYTFEAKINAGNFNFTRTNKETDLRVNTAVLSGQIVNGVLSVSVNGSSTNSTLRPWTYMFAGRAASARQFSLVGDYVVAGIKARAAPLISYATKLRQHRRSRLADRRTAPISPQKSKRVKNTSLRFALMIFAEFRRR